MTAQPYVPPRGPDGKILIGPLLHTLEDEEQSAPEPVLRTSKVGEAPPPPRRPMGDLPTPFGQQQAKATQKAPPQWQMYAAGALAVALFAWAVWAMLGTQRAPAPIVPPTAAITTPATEAPGVNLPRPTLERAVIAFAEPGGAPVGALEPGRPVLTVEERGEWRLLEAEGSGAVWVRTWEMDGTQPPTPTPVPPTAAPLPPPAPVYTAPPPAQTNWANAPIVGRAESPDGVYVCESRISQADAEACVAALMEGGQ